MTIKQSFVVITSIVILVVIGGIVAYHSIRTNAIDEANREWASQLASETHKVDSLVSITKIPQAEKKIIVYYPIKKSVKDSIFNAGIEKGIDSLRGLFNFVAQDEDTTVHFDSTATLYHHYDPLSHIGIFDLQLAPIPVKKVRVVDSIFVQTPIQTGKPITIRTAGAVVIGSGVGAVIAGVPGAAIGGFVGLAFDWLF